MPRAAFSYRAARRNKSRRLKQVWRALGRIEISGRGSPIYVPPLRTQEEAADAERHARA